MEAPGAVLVQAVIRTAASMAPRACRLRLFMRTPVVKCWAISTVALGWLNGQSNRSLLVPTPPSEHRLSAACAYRIRGLPKVSTAKSLCPAVRRMGARPWGVVAVAPKRLRIEVAVTAKVG